ncbi:sterol desaturase family protein [Curvivirga aplysinae]|uniref:sterol desaturase family protein n=1 Tax=Curvivirga aplysinae TaxID=2529852 RepID=UPI001C3FE577|nr:sterol desaturase family protein [Curvivirga aplysinae]
MKLIFNQLTDMEIYGWEAFIGDWLFIFSFAFLALEFLRYGLREKMSWGLIGDVFTNYITLGAFIGINYLIIGGFYVGVFFYVSEYAIWTIETNWATVAICIILADIMYYWQHRFAHRVNVAWATHTVHHSSPHFNISVAYRFGPLDGVLPLPFYIPLVLLGFNPFVVFFAEMFVQLYQTLLHTEGFGKFPRIIEKVMNTPSHHRVHHGSNNKYLDKNYGGIFIIWDRMFGTFAEEKEEVVYGLVTPIKRNDPFSAFFHGFYRLGQKVFYTKGLFNKIGCLIMPPGWEPAHQKRQIKQ